MHWPSKPARWVRFPLPAPGRTIDTGYWIPTTDYSLHGSVAQWQSRELITRWLQVRILSDPLIRFMMADSQIGNLFFCLLPQHGLTKPIHQLTLVSFPFPQLNPTVGKAQERSWVLDALHPDYPALHRPRLAYEDYTPAASDLHSLRWSGWLAWGVG